MKRRTEILTSETHKQQPIVTCVSLERCTGYTVRFLSMEAAASATVKDMDKQQEFYLARNFIAYWNKPNAKYFVCVYLETQINPLTSLK